MFINFVSYHSSYSFFYYFFLLLFTFELFPFLFLFVVLNNKLFKAMMFPLSLTLF